MRAPSWTRILVVPVAVLFLSLFLWWLLFVATGVGEGGGVGTGPIITTESK